MVPVATASQLQLVSPRLPSSTAVAATTSRAARERRTGDGTLLLLAVAALHANSLLNTPKANHLLVFYGPAAKLTVKAASSKAYVGAGGSDGVGGGGGAGQQLLDAGRDRIDVSSGVRGTVP